jgi:hypothetical protein
MVSRRFLYTHSRWLFVGAIFLCASLAAAQRHGGGGPGGIPGGSSRPGGVDEKDTLQDFHHAMAVQATSEQVAAFRALVKSTDDAKTKLQAFEQQKGNTTPASAAAMSGTQVSETLENLRASSKKFVDGFSDKQKSGLKDLIKRFTKADSDLETEEKRLDQSLQPANGAARADSVDKALADFSNEQLALGREMGIILASADDVAFIFMPVKNTATVGNQTTVVDVSGGILQTSAQNGQRKFKLEMVADLVDLQQNITAVLRTQIEHSTGCGERLVLRQASIAPSTPTSTLVLQLHYERWSCRGSISSELAEGDGTVEMKLTPALNPAIEKEQPNSLKLTAVFSRIDANGMMAESLRTGDLGDDLRDRVSQAILPAIKACADFKTSLPPAVQAAAVVQNVKFQDGSAGRLTVVLDGQMEVSNDQVNLMASQLNQNLAAQGTASR